MNPWRTQAVTLNSSGETIHVLPREIDGLIEAGIIDKGGKSTRVRVTPKADAKEAERIAKEKEEKEAGKTKEEKNPGGTKTKKVTGTTEVTQPVKRPVNITSPKAQ